MVVGAVAVPTAVAAWPRGESCSTGSRLVHLGQKGQVEGMWSLCVPQGMRVARFEVPHDCVTSTGAWISTFETKVPSRRRPPSPFSADGIAVRFGLDSEANPSGPDSPGPLRLADLTKLTVGARATHSGAMVIRDHHLYHLGVWIGSRVRPADQRAIDAMLASLRFTPGKPAASSFGMVNVSLP
ncbi:MAG TPA: hypothetical protein VKA30_01270 [Actinomycetota bacterium]|nr:hypothetical protein [Actinomycetota bacterium]